MVQFLATAAMLAKPVMFIIITYSQPDNKISPISYCLQFLGETQSKVEKFPNKNVVSKVVNMV